MITKKKSPKGRSVRVTFELPEEVVENKAAVVGSFNDWDETKDEMTYDKKKGVWKRSISFKPGETVEFRYYIDGGKWLNEQEADRTVVTPFGSENSVLEL